MPQLCLILYKPLGSANVLGIQDLGIQNPHNKNQPQTYVKSESTSTEITGDSFRGSEPDGRTSGFAS